MLFLDGPTLRSLLSPAILIEALREAFRDRWMPLPRQVTDISAGKGRLLLTMPAFASDGGGVVKLTTIFPENPQRNLPSIQGAIVLFSATGTPVAVLDGAVITHLRTAAASALASSYLSRADSSRLLLAGSGALAPYLAQAHCTVRPIECVRVWGRNPARSAATANSIVALVGENVAVTTIADLDSGVPGADIISCATSTISPILRGRLLREGTHVDLVGSFQPSKREADDVTIIRSRLFVDTREGALSEAGDIIDPVKRRIIATSHILGDLADLVTGRSPGRTDIKDITAFKSVGTAIEDLAAARAALLAHSQGLCN